MANHDKYIRVGSRKSELALIQTKHVISRLQKIYPNKKFEIHTMTTIGDRVLNISLPKIGEKSLFTRDLEDALRTGGVDLVVHSLKDLPTALPLGMAIGAVLEREDARDALVLRENYKGYSLSTLPLGSVIGTSSLRRAAQLRRQYPNVTVCDIRGNLNTRLSKLDAKDSKYAGIILAQAGLVRMGWQERVSQILEPTDILYAVGQGALAIECRSNDVAILSMLRSLMCLPTTCRILAERSFLKTLGGGCSAPVAVFSNLKGDLAQDGSCVNTVNLHLDGAVWSLDGSIEIRKNLSCFLAVPNGNDEPAIKRQRRSDSDSPELQINESPPVINADPEIDALSGSYNINDLVEKHINLAKQCPVVCAESRKNADNGNLTTETGGGDCDRSTASACPLSFDIGQDFMGQCPFLAPEAQASLFSDENGILSDKTNCNRVSPKSTISQDECLEAPTTSKCPFSSMHYKKDLPRNVNTHERVHTEDQVKCPFLKQTVRMFDYADNEKPPKSSTNNILIEDVDELFCGLFHHACYDRDLYDKSNKLGQQLAQDLIEKGALDVMKVAQAEIHSKV